MNSKLQWAMSLSLIEANKNGYFWGNNLTL